MAIQKCEPTPFCIMDEADAAPSGSHGTQMKGTPMACKPREVVLQVEDTGPGIPAAERERVFQPFYRVLGTQVEGSGLGLAIVHGIVHDHGGTIRLRSAPGEGTCFEVHLPVIKKAPVVVEPLSVPVAPLAGAGRRVLLVDDEEVLRTFVAAVLTMAVRLRRCRSVVRPSLCLMVVEVLDVLDVVEVLEVLDVQRCT